jgi:peptidoglycan/xylan/chitin deacetylase (PgdA/CDA1 family)
MRWDRFITLNLIQPWQRAGLVGSARRLPILMYHSISDEAERGVAPYYRVCTSPEVFRKHLAFLVNAGYRSVPLTAVVELLRQGQALPEKSVVITFDDGFRNFYAEAFPVLQQHGFSASVFLPTAFIASQRRSFKGRECLTWAEVRELQKWGIHFGSHTVSHPRLIELSWQDIERELTVSKSELEQQLGESVTTFAHPYAFPQTDRGYVAGFKALLVRSGYTCCATTEIGRVKPGAEPYRLKRLPVNSMDDLALFRAKLEGGYDWLAWPQTMIKKLKSLAAGVRKRRSPAAEPAPALPHH